MLIKKIFLISLGIISIILGVIGLIFPVLPTTPFLLLAAFCFLRSSNKLYNWLINHKLFGSMLDNYIKYKAITKKTKIIAIVFLWCSLLLSVYLTQSVYIAVFLFVTGISVSIYILHLKTLNNENKN